MHTMTMTAIAAPAAPQPLAYQHRARLLCASCFNSLDMRPRPYRGTVLPIPTRIKLRNEQGRFFGIIRV